MSQASASSQPPPSAQPETAATSGVFTIAEPLPEARRRVVERLGEGALAHRPDVGAGGEDLLGAGDHDAAHLGVGVERSSSPAISSIISGESALRASGRFSRSSATWNSSIEVSTSCRPSSTSASSR